MPEAITNISWDKWLFIILAFASIIGFCMALMNKSPRLILGVVSFPGFVAQVLWFGMSIYSTTHFRPDVPLSQYLFHPFLMAFIVNFLFFGLPLISFLVMIGVVVIALRRKQGLTRWTPATGAALGLTILSYAIVAYLSFASDLYTWI